MSRLTKGSTIESIFVNMLEILADVVKEPIGFESKSSRALSLEVYESTDVS